VCITSAIFVATKAIRRKTSQVFNAKAGVSQQTKNPAGKSRVFLSTFWPLGCDNIVSGLFNFWWMEKARGFAAGFLLFRGLVAPGPD
jgi:hypothetical protein